VLWADFVMSREALILLLLPPLPALPELPYVLDFRGFSPFLGPEKRFLQSYRYVITVLELHNIW
jgi:hypothetical protein